MSTSSRTKLFAERSRSVGDTDALSQQFLRKLKASNAFKSSRLHEELSTSVLNENTPKESVVVEPPYQFVAPPPVVGRHAASSELRPEVRSSVVSMGQPVEDAKLPPRRVQQMSSYERIIMENSSAHTSSADLSRPKSKDDSPDVSNQESFIIYQTPQIRVRESLDSSASPSQISKILFDGDRDSAGRASAHERSIGGGSAGIGGTREQSHSVLEPSWLDREKSQDYSSSYLLGFTEGGESSLADAPSSPEKSRASPGVLPLSELGSSSYMSKLQAENRSEMPETIKLSDTTLSRPILYESGAAVSSRMASREPKEERLFDNLQNLPPLPESTDSIRALLLSEKAVEERLEQLAHSRIGSRMPSVIQRPPEIKVDTQRSLPNFTILQDIESNSLQLQHQILGLERSLQDTGSQIDSLATKQTKSSTQLQVQLHDLQEALERIEQRQDRLDQSIRQLVSRNDFDVLSNLTEVKLSAIESKLTSQASALSQDPNRWAELDEKYKETSLRLLKLESSIDNLAHSQQKHELSQSTMGIKLEQTSVELKQQLTALESQTRRAVGDYLNEPAPYHRQLEQTVSQLRRDLDAVQREVVDSASGLQRQSSDLTQCLRDQDDLRQRLGSVSKVSLDTQARVDDLVKTVSNLKGTLDEELAPRKTHLPSTHDTSHILGAPYGDFSDVSAIHHEPVPRTQTSSKDDNLGPNAAAAVRKLIGDAQKSLAESLAAKVDTAVLEELMRHLSTREELERHVEGRLKLALSKLKLPAQSTINTLLKRLESKISRVRADVMKHTDRLGAQLSASAGSGSPISQTRELIEDMVKDHTIDIRHELESRFNQLKREILTDHAPDEPLHARQKGGRVKKSPLRSEIREYINRKMDDELHRVEDELAEMRRLVQDLEPRQESDGSEALPVRDTESSRDELEAVDTAVKGLRREFDEKLYMICSDLSSCKLAYQQSLQEPFHKCARWLWKSGALKYGSAVPWNYETLNTDPDNFRWEQDQINIRIAQPGLYEIAFAFFTKAKPSIQLVVNGESVLSAINSASYVVHHSSGFITTGDGKVQEGTVAGLSLLDFLALPSKSTISLHYHGGKKNSLGHGFLSLRQLF